MKQDSLPNQFKQHVPDDIFKKQAHWFLVVTFNAQRHSSPDDNDGTMYILCKALVVVFKVISVICSNKFNLKSILIIHATKLILYLIGKY